MQYVNTPMPFTAIFTAVKNDHFQMEVFDILLFLLKMLIVHTYTDCASFGWF